MRKSGEAIAKWQQVDYDTLNPCGIQYENDFRHKPEGEHVHADNVRKQDSEKRVGGGHGASMGLIRHIFKRFDTTATALTSTNCAWASNRGTGHHAFRRVLDGDRSGCE